MSEPEIKFGPQEPLAESTKDDGAMVSAFVRWMETFQGSTHSIQSQLATAFYAGWRAKRRSNIPMDTEP